MLRKRLLPLFLGVLASLGAMASAQAPGSQLPPLKLTGLSQARTAAVEDLHGRALLIEFFAYW